MNKEEFDISFLKFSQQCAWNGVYIDGLRNPYVTFKNKIKIEQSPTDFGKTEKEDFLFEITENKKKSYPL